VACSPPAASPSRTRVDRQNRAVRLQLRAAVVVVAEVRGSRRKHPTKPEVPRTTPVEMPEPAGELEPAAAREAARPRSPVLLARMQATEAPQVRARSCLWERRGSQPAVRSSVRSRSSRKPAAGTTTATPQSVIHRNSRARSDKQCTCFIVMRRRTVRPRTPTSPPDVPSTGGTAAVAPSAAHACYRRSSKQPWLSSNSATPTLRTTIAAAVPAGPSRSRRSSAGFYQRISTPVTDAGSLRALAPCRPFEIASRSEPRQDGIRFAAALQLRRLIADKWRARTDSVKLGGCDEPTNLASEPVVHDDDCRDNPAAWLSAHARVGVRLG
jgi:hypothetical protein